MSRIEKEFLAVECGVDESEVYNSFVENALTLEGVIRLKCSNNEEMLSIADYLDYLFFENTEKYHKTVKYLLDGKAAKVIFDKQFIDFRNRSIK